MPHVILKGPLTPEDIWLAFDPTEFQEEGNVYKVEDAYLSAAKDVLLLRVLTVERGFSQHFLMRIAAREGGLSVAVDRMATPERNYSVQRLVGLCAWRLLQAAPELAIETTNIPEMVREPAG
jgi:hypothetical protein